MVNQFGGPFPVVNPEVFEAERNIRYLKAPGVAVVNVPSVDLSGVQAFLDGFPEELGFGDYLSDPTVLEPSDNLAKFAGQLCYMSFGPKRTMNSEAGKYFDNVKESGHGSIVEHVGFSVLWWGISRSLTHELVRHRAGFGFSQVSQRYVGGKTLRFIERPEYQGDDFLHKLFLKRIVTTFDEYEELTNYLSERQKNGTEILSAERVTDLRKKVRQASRSVLRNETEAAVLVTANIRAWRHFFNMRVSEHAETEIRRAGFETFNCLSVYAPNLFSDFTRITLSDGTNALSTPYPKV